MAAVQESAVAGADVITDSTVRVHHRVRATTSMLQFCRAQPELAGLIIGVAFSAPLVVILLNA